MVAISILCWSRTCSSSDFCLWMLFLLSCRRFRLFELFVGLLLCVVCELLFVVVLSGVLVYGDWFWSALNDWFMFSAVWVFVLVLWLSSLWMLHFHVFVYCLMLIPLHFMCVQYVGVKLQRIDPWERVMSLLNEGHVYFVCGPLLLSMSPASVSVRRAYSASKPFALVEDARWWLAKKKTGVSPPFRRQG